MEALIIKLFPDRLANPDLDIRYVLPDLLAERSGGLIQEDGYDYGENNQALLLFLRSARLDEALACILDIIENELVLGNELKSAALVAVVRPGGDEVVFPKGFQGTFVK